MQRLRVFLVGLVLVMAACQSNPATAGPTASVAAVPTSGASQAAVATEAPSPTAADVAKAFLAQMVTATAGKLAIRGTLELGTLTGQVTGSMSYAQSNTDQTTNITIGGTTTSTSSIHLQGIGYTKTGNGPWLTDTVPPQSGQDLVTVLKALSSVVDKGVEAHDGVQAHRIELGAGVSVSPAAFGLSNPAMVNPALDLVFYAADDGKPVAMVVTVTWTQTVNGSTVPVKMALDFAFTQVGGSVTISSPDHVWQRFTSTRFHYAIAYPDDWDVDTSGKTTDQFVAPAFGGVVAARFKTQGLGLNTIAKSEISYNKTHFKWVSTANVAFVLAGVKARLITYHGTISGTKTAMYEVLAVKGSYFYDIVWISPVGNEAADLATFKEMLSTFAFR
jgi:hypothetical protein